MHENKVILLVITGGEKWHYLATKILSTLLRRINRDTMSITNISIDSIHSEQRTNSNHLDKYGKAVIIVT